MSSVSSLLGVRQVPRQIIDDGRPLADQLSDSLPKPLAHELCRALGIEVPKPNNRGEATDDSDMRQLSRKVLDRFDWIRRIEDKDDPDRELLLAPDSVKYAPPDCFTTVHGGAT